jgi:hypothetical protein
VDSKLAEYVKELEADLEKVSACFESGAEWDVKSLTLPKRKPWTLPRILVFGVVGNLKPTHSPPLDYSDTAVTVLFDANEISLLFLWDFEFMTNSCNRRSKMRVGSFSSKISA